jgi:hypothetical protein
VARDAKSSLNPVPDPYFEPIGAGTEGVSGPEAGNDGGTRRRAPIVRAAVLAGAGRWVAALGSFRFWATALGILCATWAGVAVLVVLPGPGGDTTQWLAAPVLTYLLASSLLPSAAALAGMHWGMSAYRPPAPRGRAGVRILAAAVTAGLQGLVLAVFILVTLLVEAAVAGQPASPAAVAAGVAAVEGFVFGAMGAAVGAIGRHAVIKRLGGWSLALFLVAGTVAAGAALVPASRSDEPVTVALNVEHAPDGSPVAYQCSVVPAGVREVYHTDRVMWLPAASPSVVFVMLAGQSGGGAGLFGWLSGALQAAADGTRVPCVNGEPRSGDAAGMPLAVVGLLLQAGVALGLAGWAHGVAGRRP